MATVEVFTVGGGEYIVNTFNAVAAWTGQGGYKSLLQVVLVMGFTMACITIAFNNDWRAWINWFLQATLIYMCLMVPRLDVHVTDRINPSLAPADVGNVPIGLAMMASFTSQVGDYLTRSSEVVFGLPNDLNYTTNGMVYGARLMQATQSVQFNDPEFAANLDDHMRNCVFYDVLLGRKSMDTLAKAPDLWAAIGPGSPARAQKFLTRNPDGTVSSAIQTCRDAYNTMSEQLTATGGPVDQVADPLAKSLYPKLLPSVAKAKLLADLGGSYSYLTGVSASAAAILKQNLLMNAVTQAMHTMSSTSGGNAVDVYAQTRAEIQTRNTYSAIGQTAMKWVPLLHIVLTVMFYALFPVLFPIFLIPGTGVSTLKGYVTGFLYLAAWGPLFVILHMILMFKGAGDITAVAGGSGSSLFTMAGISGISDDISALAGYLIASVPFIAGGVAKGAMAISHNATSFLNPSQNAAEAAAGEASTGNISAGNTTLDNFSYNSKQGNIWSSAAGYTSGASVFNTRDDQGNVVSDYGNGNPVVDQHGGISRLAVTPQLSHELQSSASTMASTTRSRADSLANTASSSVSSANTQASDFRHQLTSGDTLDRNYGSADVATIGSTFNSLDQAATALQNKYGFDRNVAEGYSNEWFHNASFNSNLGIGNGGGGGGGGAGGSGGGGGKGGLQVPAGAGVAASTGKTMRSTDTGAASGSDSLSKAQDFLASFGRQHNWGQQKESFDRATHNTSNSDLKSRADTVSASYSRAATVGQEARQSYETAQRFEEAASLRDSNGVSITENESQRFQNFAMGEVRKLTAMGIPHEWNPTRQATAPGEIAERDHYIREFTRARMEQIKAGVEPSMIEPTPAGLSRPGANTQTKINQLSDDGTAAVRARGLPVGPDIEGRIDADRWEVTAGVQANADRIGGYVNRRATEFNRVQKSISPNPKETLDRVGQSIHVDDSDKIPGLISRAADALSPSQGAKPRP